MCKGEPKPGILTQDYFNKAALLRNTTIRDLINGWTGGKGSKATHLLIPCLYVIDPDPFFFNIDPFFFLFLCFSFFFVFQNHVRGVCMAHQ